MITMSKSGFLKRIVLIFIVLTMLSLCACGGNSGGGTNNDNQTASGGVKDEGSGGVTPVPAPSEPKFSDNVYSVDLCDEITRKYLSAISVAEEYAIMSKYGGSMHDSQTVTRITIKNGKAPV